MIGTYVIHNASVKNELKTERERGDIGYAPYVTNTIFRIEIRSAASVRILDRPPSGEIILEQGESFSLECKVTNLIYSHILFCIRVAT